MMNSTDWGNPVNRHKLALTNRDIVAIDGEGVTEDDNTHKYIMLVCSNGNHVINEQGLTTGECLKFL
jgi:hypothetical protein